MLPDARLRYLGTPVAPPRSSPDVIEEVCVKNIVESVLRSYGHEVSFPLKERLLNYISLLASVGIADEELLTFGKAYLKEISQPDSRYTGC